jgi:methionyl-tRNA formyltransferase
VRIAVAATAPFGADVLERLAARHEVAYLLTRPDRPRGRGRRVGSPPAKEAAERLGIEVRQPESVADFDPEEDVVVLAAYGALIPETVLDRALWLNRRDDHQARAGARRRPDRGAAGLPGRR